MALCLKVLNIKKKIYSQKHLLLFVSLFGFPLKVPEKQQFLYFCIGKDHVPIDKQPMTLRKFDSIDFVRSLAVIIIVNCWLFSTVCMTDVHLKKNA